MLTKQTIVIFGAGNTGKAIATCLAGGNFHVLLCDKEFEKAEALAKATRDSVPYCDVEAMQCLFDGAWEADIIIFTMHFEEQKEVAGIIKDVANQKILVSSVEPGIELNGGQASGHCDLQELQQMLPNTKIVKILSDNGIHQTGAGKNLGGVVISGNDETAVEAVCLVLESVGIHPMPVRVY